VVSPLITRLANWTGDVASSGKPLRAVGGAWKFDVPVISITDNFCGGAILDIDAVSVLDVVFMLGVVARFVCVCIARRFQR
jgi:hypothetical protein